MTTLEELSKTVAEIREQRGDKMLRWPEEVRKSVIKLFEDGIGRREIAERTGLANSLVTGWISRAKGDKEPAFQRVRIIAPKKIEKGCFTLRSLSGLKVEGLNLEEVTQVLRRLG